MTVTLRLLIATLVLSLSATAQAEDSRVFEFHYRMLASELPTHAPVDIYIPLPVEDQDQRILAQKIRSSIPGQKGIEARFSNGYYHIHRPANINNPIDADIIKPQT